MQNTVVCGQGWKGIILEELSGNGRRNNILVIIGLPYTFVGSEILQQDPTRLPR